MTEFQRLIYMNYFKQMKWLLLILAIIFAINMYLVFFDRNYLWQILIFLEILLFAYFILTPISTINISQTSLDFMSRHCEIDESFLSIYYEDGSYTKINHEHFVKVTNNFNYYFFHINKCAIEYLPLSALETEQDICYLNRMIQEKNN